MPYDPKKGTLLIPGLLLGLAFIVRVDTVLAEIPRPGHLGELHFSFTACNLRAATAYT